jgi:hypothetical protein
MNPIASLSLTTYPHPTPPKIAANPVAVVEQMGLASCCRHHCRYTRRFEPAVELFSRLPNNIREAEAASRKCGTTLLQAVSREACKAA